MSRRPFGISPKHIEELIARIWRRNRKEKQKFRETARKILDDHAKHGHRSMKETVRAAREREERVPGKQGEVARKLFETLVEELSPTALSFGGGTVLAARWKHRRSEDVDLFCRPDVFAQLGREARDRIEKRIKRIQGCNPEVTWCEDIGLYTEVDGIEATMLPRSRIGSEHGNKVLEGTTLQLQTNEEILYAKIVHRMYETGEINARDIYDVACARTHDPQALDQAVRRTDREIVRDVIATISDLPRGWTEDGHKPLLDARYRWEERELATQAVAALTETRQSERDTR